MPGRQIVEPVFSGPALVKRVLREIDALHEAVARNPRTLALARNAADVAGSVAAGKIAVVLGLNAGWIDEDLSILRSYHLLGLRVMALCHDAALSWADSEMEYRPGGPGLTEFGRSVVREMNRLGIIVDVSHASDQTVRDVLAVSSEPAIASHSGCRLPACAVRRNLPDDLIRGIADGGGVIGVSVRCLAARRGVLAGRP